MRYDSESNIIKIHLGEFVSIARRGISPTASYDEDEPNLTALTKTRLQRIIGIVEPRELSYRFNDGRWDMELCGRVESLCGNEITVAKMMESSPRRPHKQELAQIRGEGYIAAFMYAKKAGIDQITIRFIYLGTSGDYAEKTEIVSLRNFRSPRGRASNRKTALNEGNEVSL